eukprot:2731430-Pyramimonas_sp.AAC.2
MTKFLLVAYSGDVYLGALGLAAPPLRRVRGSGVGRLSRGGRAEGGGERSLQGGGERGWALPRAQTPQPLARLRLRLARILLRLRLPGVPGRGPRDCFGRAGARVGQEQAAAAADHELLGAVRGRDGEHRHREEGGARGGGGGRREQRVHGVRGKHRLQLRFGGGPREGRPECGRPARHRLPEGLGELHRLHPAH